MIEVLLETGYFQLDIIKKAQNTPSQINKTPHKLDDGSKFPFKNWLDL